MLPAISFVETDCSSTAVAIENSRLFSESVQMAEKERYVRNIFQKYVPEAVADEILERGDRDLIGLGERRLVTLLNVDIRGYSRMSKKLRSEDVVSVLNYFFMTMGSAVLKHHGILDKYLGDGILAYFGAPEPLPDDSQEWLARGPGGQIEQPGPVALDARQQDLHIRQLTACSRHHGPRPGHVGRRQDVPVAVGGDGSWRVRSARLSIRKGRSSVSQGPVEQEHEPQQPDRCLEPCFSSAAVHARPLYPICPGV